MCNAVQKVFGSEVIVHMCFFHLCQTLFRLVQKNFLGQFFQSEKLRDEFALLCCLPMCPEDKVINAFNDLYPILSTNMRILADHLDKNYLRGNTSSTQGKKKGPKFPIPKWNIYELMRKGDPKTNNYSESFNHRFSHMIGPKTGVFPFMEQLRKEHHTEAKIELAMSGKVPGKHRKQEEHVKALMKVAANFDKYDTLLDYLKYCRNNLKVHSIVKVDPKSQIVNRRNKKEST